MTRYDPNPSSINRIYTNAVKPGDVAYVALMERFLPGLFVGEPWFFKGKAEMNRSGGDQGAYVNVPAGAARGAPVERVEVYGIDKSEQVLHRMCQNLLRADKQDGLSLGRDGGTVITISFADTHLTTTSRSDLLEAGLHEGVSPLDLMNEDHAHLIDRSPWRMKAGHVSVPTWDCKRFVLKLLDLIQSGNMPVLIMPTKAWVGSATMKNMQEHAVKMLKHCAKSAASGPKYWVGAHGKKPFVPPKNGWQMALLMAAYHAPIHPLRIVDWATLNEFADPDGSKYSRLFNLCDESIYMLHGEHV